MSNKGRGAATGFVQGASTGAAVGGPVGAVIGAVIGTAWGTFAGGLGDKAEKKLKQAKQLQRLREKDAYKQRLLSTLRQGRIQRASSLAAAVAANAINSSGTEAALSSIGSQIANQVEYMSVDQGRAVKIEQLTSKAGKLAKRAETHQQAMSATSTAISLGALAASDTAAATGTQGAGDVAAKSMYAVPVAEVGAPTTIAAMSPVAVANFLSQAPQAAALQVGPQMPATSTSWLNSFTNLFR